MTIVCNHFYERYNWFEVSSINDTRPIGQLKKIVVENNDKSVYNELRYAYLNELESNEILVYSFLMANKVHDRQAYFDIYSLLSSAEHRQEIRLDKEAKTLMIEYLKKGAALNHHQSKFDLGQLYMEGKYVPKDTVLGQKLINTSGY
ncbi:hypothetical protein BSYN_15820 [Bacteroides sedimenti]|uniref:Uncharacterized protein n=2 Tax=Bacteroides sedimenti TaxID=2136147 RepID=A0ABM8IBC9_9BACE